METMNPKMNIKDLASTNRSAYLACLEEWGIEPNFWCSLEYFQKAGWREIVTDQMLFVIDEEGHVMLPPLSLKHQTANTYVPNKGLWADLVGFSPIFAEGQTCHFLDYQYIYDPGRFFDMSGGQWSTFRKNSRKFPQRYGEDSLVLATDVKVKMIEDFVPGALKQLKGETIHDIEVMMKYLFFGENRLFLLDLESGQILSINIWDENHQYINYRYCLCSNISFLSEYSRLGFYKYIFQKNKMVNDGGVLDRPSLKLFKDKLNPIAIRDIHTWK